MWGAGQRHRARELPGRAPRPPCGTSAAAASSSIQGFATDISVNRGGTVTFKVDTNAPDYQLDIYRMGYYGGDGARLVAHRAAVGTLPQTQPACLTNGSTGLVRLRQLGSSRRRGRCRPPPSRGSTSRTLVRSRHGRREPHRLRRAQRRRRLGPAVPDLGHDLAGLQHLRRQQPLRRRPRVGPARATRSATTGPSPRAATAAEDWVFNAEYPMVRWLERNGYDVSYMTGVDSDRRGALIREPQGRSCRSATTSIGRAPQRANVEAARDAGVNLAFFSGNEMFWKTRWENSIDGTNPTARSSPTRRPTRTPRSTPTTDAGPARGATRAVQPAPRAAGPRTR